MNENEPSEPLSNAKSREERWLRRLLIGCAVAITLSVVGATATYVLGTLRGPANAAAFGKAADAQADVLSTKSPVLAANKEAVRSKIDAIVSKRTALEIEFLATGISPLTASRGQDFMSRVSSAACNERIRTGAFSGNRLAATCIQIADREAGFEQEELLEAAEAIIAAACDPEGGYEARDSVDQKDDLRLSLTSHYSTALSGDIEDFLGWIEGLAVSSESCEELEKPVLI